MNEHREHLLDLPFEDAAKIAQYQIDRMQKAAISPLVKIRIGADEGGIHFYGDTEGLRPIHDHFSLSSVPRGDWIRFLTSLLKTAAWCSDRLIDPVCLSVHPAAYYRPDDAGIPAWDGILFVCLPVRETGMPSRSPVSCAGLADRIAGIAGADHFTPEEWSAIRDIDLYHAEDGLAQLSAFRENTVAGEDEEKAGLKSLLKVVSRLLQLRPGRMTVLLSALAAQTVLLMAVFRILRSMDRFRDKFPPALLAALILLAIGVSDIILFFHPASPFRIRSRARGSGRSRDDPDLFAIREEKTSLLTGIGESSRIAMLCSGIPGTPEEASGQKAYILVDDFLIGRDRAKADFRIESLSVGRMHARITRKHDSFFIEDMDSRNGTFVDKMRLKKCVEYPLPDKCRIRFADREFFFVAT